MFLNIMLVNNALIKNVCFENCNKYKNPFL